ncbi:histone H3-like [Thrips palmi]|uniref:Histone H3-like n=1 Tax=Thrips palmi TaxID=161013 RepID=A0A6P9A1H2_THRPL|nr:histone H3-like [Thrips palmi]
MTKPLGRKSSVSQGRKKPNQKTPIKQTGQKNVSPSKPNRSSVNKDSTMDVSRRTRRFKSGTKALREIKALQRTTHLLIPKAPFCRVVKEIVHQFSYENLRIQSSALAALQEAAEMYMVQFFEDSLLCTLHAKRVTLNIQDCHLMRRLRGPAEVANK